MVVVQVRFGQFDEIHGTTSTTAQTPPLHIVISRGTVVQMVLEVEQVLLVQGIHLVDTVVLEVLDGYLMVELVGIMATTKD